MNWENSQLVTNVFEHISRDFSSEKEMCNYIESNIEAFARDILEIDYNGHDREFYLGQSFSSKSGNLPRVDFSFKTTEGKCILVECKNSKNSFTELVASIAQILAYKCISDSNNIKADRICIVTSGYTPLMNTIIDKFNLPIEVYIFSKTRALKLMKNNVKTT